jgi:hypothetical protein
LVPPAKRKTTQLTRLWGVPLSLRKQMRALAFP